MKIITLQKIGYNHPSQANSNWNYDIFCINLIDTNKGYNMSHLCKMAFSGDSHTSRMLQSNISRKIHLIKAVYTDTGTQKITGISKMLNADSKELIQLLKDFIANK